MSVLVLPVTTWLCWIIYRNEHADLLVFHTSSLEPLAHCQNVASLSLSYLNKFDIQ